MLWETVIGRGRRVAEPRQRGRDREGARRGQELSPCEPVRAHGDLLG